MKRLFVLVLCVVLLISMVGCGNNAQGNHDKETKPTEENPTSQTQPVEEPTSQSKWYLTQHTEETAASVELPDFIMEDEALKQLTCEYIQSRFVNFDGDFSLTISNEDVTVPPQDYLYYLDLDCRISYISDEIASVIFEGTYSMKTAAHPTHMFFTLNINRTTNERIRTYDVLPVNEALYAAFVLCAYESLAEKANEDWLAGIRITDLCSESSFYSGLIGDKGDAYAYFTEMGLGISYAVPHPLGDHQETEIPYSVVGITKPEDALEKPSTTVTLFDGRFTYDSSADYLYTYQIYDKSGAVVAEDTFKYFQLYPLRDTILAVFVQAGNTIAARGGFFYDFANDRQSERFHYIVGFSDTLVVTAGAERVVIVQSIFDDSFYLELSDFEYPLANSIEWLQDAELSLDGKSVTITYLSGEHYEKKTQIFELP